MRELTLPPVNAAELVLPLPRLATILGYPEGKKVEAHSREVLNEAGHLFAVVARVNWRAVAVAVEKCERDEVSLEGGEKLSSTTLSARLKKAGGSETVIAGITLGAELDERITELNSAGRPDHSFFLDAVATCAMEVLSQNLYVRVCEEMASVNLIALPRTAPGYGSWNLSDQHRLKHILGAGSSFPVSILESGMLDPVRSILSLFPLTADPDHANSDSSISPCASCGALDCAYRRVERKSHADLPIFVPKGDS